VSVSLVFAPDTLVRFKGGRILVHTTTSPMPAFESDNPMLIGWLCQFARPTQPDTAIGALQPENRPMVTQVIGYLRQSGALQEVGPSAAPAGDTEAEGRIKNHLQLLARSLYDTSCDLLGLGPQADAALLERTGIGVERRLMALLAATDGLRSELNSLRQPHLKAQLAALRVRPGDRELKLHIGCGTGHLEDWVNIDVHPAPLAMNVLWGLPFADGSVRYVFVSHFLEHLFFPRDVMPFLAEIRRVLAPGGVARLVVPDIGQCIDAYVNADADFYSNRRETWPWWPANPTRLEDFLAYAGAGAEPAHLFESHKYGYDFETLSKILTAAGLERVERSGFLESAHPALRVDDVSAVAKAKYRDRYYSLFAEAQRPT